MIEEKDVTIIVPHLGTTKETKYSLSQCLMSLSETTTSKVLVIKNGNTEPLEGFASKFPALYLREQGQCKAANIGVKMAKTPWILITNDDMVYPAEWFKRLVEIPDDVYCVSPKLIEPRPGAPTFEVHFCGGAGGDFDKNKWNLFVSEYYHTNLERPLRTGFNLPFLMRKDLFEFVGGYDTNFDPWGSNSDSDLEYKIKLAGVQPMQNTNSIVYHFSQTSGTFEPKNQAFWSKNFAYFQEKWGFPRTDNGIWEANFEMPKPPERIFVPDWEGKYGSK